MLKKILIMGLPGSGKSTLAKAIIASLEQLNISCSWYNADNIRRIFEDWDFSSEGRERQAIRMGEFADRDVKKDKVAVCDFVCPTDHTRKLFGSADLVVWMDTISSGRFDDTNKIFVQPSEFNLRIKSFNDAWADVIVEHIVKGTLPQAWNNRAPTVQMLGRWQPWHAGHQALFERLLEKTGQVSIQIRDCQGWNSSNPYDTAVVEKNIHAALEPKYSGKYTVTVVPNIVHIGWGRGVGYTSGEETFDEAVTSISATNIRKDLGLQ
jgi:adenylylsulfate kinase